jgi:Domain of unknown function (DUF4160)
MPRPIRFSNSEVAIFFAEHNPPHFHVLGKDGAAQIEIATLEIMQMSGKLDLREAMDWAAENRELLEAKWQEFSGGEV